MRPALPARARACVRPSGVLGRRRRAVAAVRRRTGPAAGTAAARPCRGASRSGARASATSSAVVALLSLGMLRLVPVGHDAPDPAAIDAAGDVHVLEDLRRQEGGPLDQLAVHVDDPEAAVGSVGHLHRAEASCRARRGTRGPPRHSGRHEHAAAAPARARWMMLLDTSPTNRLPWNSAGKASPR